MTNETADKAGKSWVWVVPYTVVIVIALVLGAALGGLGFFKTTTLGTPKLTAATLVQFLSFGGALALFWLLAQRAMRELRGHADWGRAASLVVLPLTTLVVVLAAYYVLMILLGALMNPTLRGIFNWLFILGTSASAIWLAVAVFRHSEALLSRSSHANTGDRDGT